MFGRRIVGSTLLAATAAAGLVISAQAIERVPGGPADTADALAGEPTSTAAPPAAAAPHSTKAGDAPAPADDPFADIEVVVEPLAEAVLPFQSVMIRITAANRSSRVIEPVFETEPFMFADDGRPSPAKIATFQSRGPRSAFITNPGDRLSTDYVVGHSIEHRITETEGKRFRDGIMEPIYFDQETTRWIIRVSVPTNGSGERYIYKTIALRLARPTGDDRDCFKLLAADPQLARRLYDIDAMIEPAHVAAFEKILAAWPESSYADYARFALARARLGNRGERLPGLVERLTVPHVSESPGFESYTSLPALRVSPLLPEHQWRGLRNALAEGSDEPFARRYVAGIRAQSHLTAGLDDRRAAVRLLDQIRRQGFPFTAQALYLKHRVAEIDEPERLQAIATQFDREHPYAPEWLGILWQVIGDQLDPKTDSAALQAWLDYRIRTSQR